MKKLDLKKALKPLYQPSAKKVSLVDVPPLRYLMLDGEGDPNTSAEYTKAVAALFTLSYTAKFLVKKSVLAVDYTVMPLEGLWWADDMEHFSVENKSNWKWTMMILQPEYVSEELLDEAREKSRTKLGRAVLTQIRLETFPEGHCAQILHIGPFSEEGPTIEKVHQFIEARGKLTGKHHEIYLSDIRKADPARWRTIVRQPLEDT
jgi:hypothetical protein